jgi:hypothetical protein
MTPCHCERSEAIQRSMQAALDCFVAVLLAMTVHLGMTSRFVTTGLDPVVHAETPYGLPDQVRQ